MVASIFDADAQAKRIAFLRQVAPFSLLADRDLITLSRDFKAQPFGRDEIIFRQGDPGEEIYIVMKGKVRIYKLAPSGNETSLEIFSTREIVGEFAPLDHHPRSASAKALEATTMLRISGDNLKRHLRAMPDLAIGIIRLLTAKARRTADFAESLAQYDAAGRLLHILLHYAERFGEELETGKRFALDLNLTQSDLASLVGVQRGWINHLLQDWHKRGLIEHRAGKIFILDFPRVMAERDGRLEALVEKDW